MAALLKAFDVPAGEWQAVLDRIEHHLQPPELPMRGGYTCADGDPVVQEYLERRERDGEIKRRTGQVHPDETYEDYEERMCERAYRQAVDDWLYEDYDEPEGDDEPEDEAQKQARAAEQAAFRAQLKVLVERATPTGQVAHGA
ncbi:hypothetical protein OG223_53755 [Streptomyces sp. NBC_01478]|uniref:hypothetical protein n=1 Tax=Streptomyces sp. NBC_01478 TaxID=2903882 RepID=UPI002E2FA0E0|nr:hypothetical protein [Streptomyces sp. NBC_01478]